MKNGISWMRLAALIGGLASLVGLQRVMTGLEIEAPGGFLLVLGVISLIELGAALALGARPGERASMVFCIVFALASAWDVFAFVFANDAVYLLPLLALGLCLVGRRMASS